MKSPYPPVEWKPVRDPLVCAANGRKKRGVKEPFSEKKAKSARENMRKALAARGILMMDQREELS